MAASNEPTRTALGCAFQMDTPYFDWLEYPGNVYLRKRFGVAMQGSRNLAPQNAVPKGTWME